MPIRAIVMALPGLMRTRCRIHRSLRKMARTSSRELISCAPCAASIPACRAVCTCTWATGRYWRRITPRCSACSSPRAVCSIRESCEPATVKGTPAERQPLDGARLTLDLTLHGRHVANDSAFRDQVRQLGKLITQFDQFPDGPQKTACKELVQLLLDVHGAGLERMMEIVFEGGSAGSLNH